MKYLKNVHSSTRPAEIEITDKAVFISDNIKEYQDNIEDYIINGYEFDQIIYSPSEYLIKLTQENNNLQQELIDTQLALVELYEGGSTND